MTKARDISKLLSTANGKIAGENLDVSFENISDTGTEGTKVASGTTAQRGSTTGQWRYNSTTGYFEGKGASDFITLEPVPTVSSVDVTDVDPTAGGTQTFVITGTNFSSGGTIAFIGADATETNAISTTFDSSTQVTAVANKSIFTNANEPYKIKFTSATNATGQSGSGLIYSDQDPSWTTASGNVGNVLEGTALTPVTLTATDPDGDTVTYSETTSALGGAGFALSSSGTITGTAQAVSGDTTTTFTARATANGKTADRSFNIITKNFNENVLLLDSTNLTISQNSIDPENYTSNTPNTAVSLTTGNLRAPTLVNGSTFVTSYYNTSGVKHPNQWSALVSSSGADASINAYWLGVYNPNGNTNVYATFDFGANPTFKIRRLTGNSEWRSGSATFYLYGTNDVSGITGTNSWSGAGATQLWSAGNPASSWDSGTFTNDTYYRYYIFRLGNASGGYDWGWRSTKIYGDYY